MSEEKMVGNQDVLDKYWASYLPEYEISKDLVASLFAELTNEERYEIMSKYCPCCGMVYEGKIDGQD